MDKLSTLVSNFYAVMLIVGGVMGFIKAHSKWSLIIGVISGLFIFVSCRIGQKNSKAAYLFVASISLLLAMFFSLRFAATHAFMPGGLMLILSITTYVLVALGWLKNK